jgi:hypothetical protein
MRLSVAITPMIDLAAPLLQALSSKTSLTGKLQEYL